MSTPLPPRQRSYLVSVAALVGLVAVAFVISCAVVHPRGGDGADSCTTLDPKDQAKYVICFGDVNGSTTNPVYVKPGFDAALNGFSGRVRINTLTEIDISGNSSKPGPAAQPTPSDHPRVHLHVVGRRTTGSACTMHVTQKVGLDNMNDVRTLLKNLGVQP